MFIVPVVVAGGPPPPTTVSRGAPITKSAVFDWHALTTSVTAIKGTMSLEALDFNAVSQQPPPAFLEQFGTHTVYVDRPRNARCLSALEVVRGVRSPLASAPACVP